MSKDLAVLFPEKELTVGGKDVTVMPYTFGTLPKVIKLMSGFAGLLMVAPSLQASIEDGAIHTNQETVDFIGELFYQGGENIFKLIALSINQPEDFVKGLQPDEGLELAMAVYEVNADFFKRRLLPLLKQVMDKAAIGINLGNNSNQEADPQTGEK